MGRILAIQLQPANGGMPPRFLVCLNVQRIVQKTQTTVLWGDSLLFSSTGMVSQNQYFSYQLKEWTNVPMTWGELSAIPNPSSFPSDYILLPQAPPIAPVNVAIATLISTGFDPIYRFWAEFQGNYGLKMFPLFQGDWYNTVGS